MWAGKLSVLVRELESYDVDGVRGLQQIIISLCWSSRLGWYMDLFVSYDS